MTKYGPMVWILSCALLAPAALRGEDTATPASSGPAAKPAGVHLIVDHLPVALYETEPLTACFRIENATAGDMKVALRVALFDAEGKELRVDRTELAPKAQAFATYQKDFRLDGVTTLRVFLEAPGGEQAGPVLRVLRDRDTYPDAEAVGGALRLKDGGARLVFFTQRRQTKDDRRWAPVRWAWGGPASAKPARVLALLPGAWGRKPEPGSESAADLSDLLPEAFAEPHSAAALGPFELDPTLPLLKAFDAAVRSLDAAQADGVILALPPEDLDVAADPRVYRTVLDALLTRLRLMGAKSLALAPPCHYGRPREQQERLWEEVRASAKAQDASVLDPGEWLDETLWRIDPKQKGVYGRAPNAEGRKKIAQKLGELLP